MSRTEASGEAVVALAGEIDMATAGSLTIAVAEALKAGSFSIMVDLAEVTFLDSSGLQALVIAHRATDGQLMVRSPQPPVRRILELTGFHDLIEA